MERLNLDEVGRERVAGIYAIHFKPTNKWYVGGSLDCYRRLKDHRYLMQISPEHHSMGADNQIKTAVNGLGHQRRGIIERVPMGVELWLGKGANIDACQNRGGGRVLQGIMTPLPGFATPYIQDRIGLAQGVAFQGGVNRARLSFVVVEGAALRQVAFGGADVDHGHRAPPGFSLTGGIEGATIQISFDIGKCSPENRAILGRVARFSALIK